MQTAGTCGKWARASGGTHPTVAGSPGGRHGYVSLSHRQTEPTHGAILQGSAKPTAKAARNPQLDLIIKTTNLVAG